MSDNSIPPASGQPYISADQIEAVPETHICHPFNENSDAFVRPLSFAAGLKRLRISITRIPPGKESFIYHAHARDEEFLYILEGRGRAEIGDEVVEVGPGDFMGFPTPSVAHHLINPYDKDLVYLMGGEHSGFDVGTFPKIGKRIVFANETMTAIEDGKVTEMSLADFLPEGLPEG